MNLLYIFLSIFFSTVSPAFNNNEGLTGNNDNGTVTNPEPGGTKHDKINNGDYIIATDIMP